MSSPPKEDNADLKAGHAPAVKVAGGVRIKQHRSPAQMEAAEAKAEAKKEEKEDEEQQKPNPNDEHKIIISGAAVKGDKDFSPQAVKAFHEKPLPAQQPSHAIHQHNIQQPRK